MSEIEPAPGVCRHCKARKVNRPLGLCWSCYYRPGVRALYPSTSKYTGKGVGLKGIGGVPRATAALPGSPEKLAVLAARAAKGQPLHSRRDERSRVCQRQPSASDYGKRSGGRRHRHERDDRPPRTRRWAGPADHLTG